MEDNAIFEIDGDGLDLDFGGSTISTPNTPAISARGTRLSIRNAVILGGSPNPRLAYRIHRLTESETRKRRRKSDRRDARRRARSWVRRHQGRVLTVLVTAVIVKWASRG